MNRILCAALAAALALTLAACGDDDDDGDTGAAVATSGAPQGQPQGFTPPKLEPMAALGTPEGEVNIVAWAGYIERGETDPAFDWVTSFEEATGCMVEVKTANTSDEMVALMNEGGFDLVTASGDASNRLTAAFLQLSGADG